MKSHYIINSVYGNGDELRPEKLNWSYVSICVSIIYDKNITFGALSEDWII